MDEILNGNFYNPTKGNLKTEKVTDELINYISEKPEKFYDIIVGCDSSSSEEPNFPLAIVILRVGETLLHKLIRCIDRRLGESVPGRINCLKVG